MIPTTIEEFLKLHADKGVYIFSVESNKVVIMVKGTVASIDGTTTPNTDINFTMTVAEITHPKTGIIVDSITFTTPEGRVTLKD